MQPLEYNLVDAYERELEDWWYEIPPAHDRFVNVIVPLMRFQAKAHVEDLVEPGVKVELTGVFDAVQE